MKDLTKNSITIEILSNAGPVAISLLSHVAYQLVSIYFVSQLGEEATAGVNAAGNLGFILAALLQILGVGPAVLVAHAVGRKDLADANLIFNQALLLSGVLCLALMPLLSLLARPFMEAMSADSAAIDAGVRFLLAAVPAYTLILPMTVMSAALRGVGLIKPPAIIFMLTVLIDVLLCPILIAGWGTGFALGASGAGLATSIAILAGLGCMATYFHRTQRQLQVHSSLLRPQLNCWRRIANIGLPSAAELVVAFLSAAIAYFAIRDLGSAVQAGFGIGTRIMQAIILPGLAVAAVAGSIASQSYGANNYERVKEVFRKASFIGALVMMATTIVIQVQAASIVGFFGASAATIDVAAAHLRFMGWILVVQGLNYTCITLFQSLGNTLPSLISASSAFVAFSISAVLLSRHPGFHIQDIWHLLIASVLFQVALNLWFLSSEFKKKLAGPALLGDRLTENR